MFAHLRSRVPSFVPVLRGDVLICVNTSNRLMLYLLLSGICASLKNRASLKEMTSVRLLSLRVKNDFVEVGGVDRARLALASSPEYSSGAVDPTRIVAAWREKELE
jgi:hypothetical protein